MSLLIIGGGNMGKSFAESFLRAKLLQKNTLHIIEKNEQQLELLKQQGFENLHTSFGDFIQSVQYIILATKPQDIQVIYDDLKPFINSNHIVISIMAGVPIESIQTQLGTTKVVRCMPNLPCQMALGVTGFKADNSIDSDALDKIIQLLNSTGIAVQLEEEDQLNAITAISGSGPAYVFYFMQSMMQQAEKYGFSTVDAEKIVSQTFLGAVELFQKNDFSTQEWIARVASKGGTTEAALRQFDVEDLSSKIQKGLDAALNRSRELSQTK